MEKKEAPFYTQYTQERKHEGLVSLEGGRGREETLIYVLLNFEAVCSSSYLEFITLLSYSCGIILYDLKIRFTQIKKVVLLYFSLFVDQEILSIF